MKTCGGGHINHMKKQPLRKRAAGMSRRRFLRAGALGAPALFASPAACADPKDMPNHSAFDIVVLGGTPGGICAAIAAARLGSRVLILERTAHIGGLPANGLGATDIATRGATGGLFKEFVSRIRAHYAQAYGADSPQVKDCSDGYHFEPGVAEKVFEAMLAEAPAITILRNRQFDAGAKNVTMQGARLTALTVTNRDSGARETYRGAVFVDATYEGDLAAAAGAPFETRREGKKEHNEPFAGRVYRRWGVGPLGEGSTEEGDDTLQAYNYRLCLTNVAENRVAITKPATYDRNDYASLADDVTSGYMKHFLPRHGVPDGDRGVVNPVRLPNGKTDTNNHHRSFLSTDLPEENWPYPTADWVWRDRFARRLRDYTLGLLWFCQHDPALPQAFRDEAGAWGLARDEYEDNGHFPRQIYVREGRRITGDYLFTARDAMAPGDIPDAYTIMEGKKPPTKNNRAPVQRDSITASHYAIDSHAVRKREKGRVHLDGFLGLALITKPYQVPYGVIVPKKVEGLLTPVPCSATHLGFGTLRMEPCWMALGQAAGAAAHLATRQNVPPRKVPVEALQWVLLRQKQVLIYLADVPPTHPQWQSLQRAGCLGCFPNLNAEPDAPIDAATAEAWAKLAGKPAPPFDPRQTTRAAYLERLLAAAPAGP